MTHKITPTILLSLLFFSCSLEQPIAPDMPHQGEKAVMLKVAVPNRAQQGGATRAINAEQENSIETLDVLAFKVEAGVYTFQYRTLAKRDVGSNNGVSIQSFNAILRVKDEAQCFVLITNARSQIDALVASRADGWVGQEKEGMLSKLTFDLNGGDRWKAVGPSNFTAIPMWGETEPIVIDPSTSSISSAPIPMVRMAAKIEVQLDQSVLGITNAFKLKSVHLYNTNQSGRIVPISGTDYMGLDKVAKKASLPYPVTPVTGPVAYTDFSAPGIPDVAMKGAIYLFETAAKNNGNFLTETCIVVGGLYGSDTQESYYRLDFLSTDGATHVDILRNHRYVCNIVSVNGRGFPSTDDAYRAKSFNMTANILAWEEGVITHIVFDNQYMLGVSRDRFDFSHEEHNGAHTDNILTVATDYPDGWTASVWADKAGTTPVPQDAVSGLPWLRIDPSSGIGDALPHPMRLLTDANIVFAERTAYIHIKAGRLTYIVTVVQNRTTLVLENEGGGTPPLNAQTYVGAFWRANQTGERLIRIDAAVHSANHGAWSATVAWMDPRWGTSGGVILSTDKLDNASLAARGISFTSDMNPDLYGTPEDCPVTGSAIAVTGQVSDANKYIFFRIGLKSTYTPTTQHPARYAVVLLSYANNTKKQLIFLRQGEGADYLMTNNDPVSSGGLSTRTATKKFSPYNLTAQNLDQSVMSQADASNPTTVGNRSIFTSYPTQAGAFWQWANTYTGTQFGGGIRWAHNPYTTAASAWQATNTPNYWSTLAATQEVCPPGYRRPYDGSITGDEPCTNISGSEVRQSLLLKPRTSYNYSSETTNSLWGYYADGFFDRRQIVKGNGTGAAVAAVAAQSKDVAHIGRLFFNPTPDSDHLYASLFIPASGVRGWDTGNLALSGAEGHFWSASRNTLSTSNCGLSFIYKDNHVGPWREEISTALTVRCVAP
ncbi:MAG: hypothetical protein FWD56_03270 [Bacteroidales bacterium]|nr:hypothetical protein [Bacteroidales bacterium]